MSDTPRTDAEVFAVDVAFVSHDGLASEPKNVIEPDFARELERENAEQCVLLGKGGERECALLGKVERLERENAALREDKEILDWLDANVDAIMLKLQPNSLRLDVREMVRKARKEGQP